ncbi:CidA/LrgA family protein [Denitromonas iodatirespirans]|uniref:CidA/LrgA family protein n=1 Tax=Denitromonas iodatirespirans TaxID=2795389 RepID=A0A944DT55_DENI1|nr:CidA/LrgA family protein [Denitromonas iodatirespirans]MBT0963994.1 CidA/LrgA family protein [Denitromonas iodatirespirans]
MLNAITVLLVFQLAGEVLARGLGLPLPGPVLGMALLLLALILRGGPGPGLQNTANGLLGHLSLLFVPAGTGIMLHADRLASEWPALLAALVLSTLAALAVSALVLSALQRRKRSRP